MSATHVRHPVFIKPSLPFPVRVDTLMSALTRATLESRLPSPHIRETLESVRRFAESGRARKGVAERVMKSYGNAVTGGSHEVAAEALALEGREISTLTRADAETLVRYTDADEGRALVFLDGLLYVSPELVRAVMSICGDRFDGRGRKAPQGAAETVAVATGQQVGPFAMPAMSITSSKGDAVEPVEAAVRMRAAADKEATAMVNAITRFFRSVIQTISGSANKPVATRPSLLTTTNAEVLRNAVSPGAAEQLMKSLRSKVVLKTDDSCSDEEQELNSAVVTEVIRLASTRRRNHRSMLTRPGNARAKPSASGLRQ
jgi:hypothetical protein